MRFILIVIFIKLSFLAVSQEKKASFQFENTNLKKVLSDIEIKYDTRFSYRNDIVSQHKIEMTISEAHLDSIITILQDKTSLIFEKISDRYITIKENETLKQITITGRLVEKSTQTPLWGGTIINSTQEIGTVSDKSGYFELKENAIFDTITIQYIGYTTIKFVVGKTKHNLPIKVQLSESSEELKEVLINFISDDIRNNDDGSIVLSAKDLNSFEASPESDYFESLQLLPGIDSPSESNSDLFIRGGTPDQNLVLWNGITMYHNSHFFGMISAFNSQNVSNIKVFRSGARAEYGNRVAGVIDMNSDTKIAKRVKGNIGINYNYADVLLAVPVKKSILSFTVSARRSYSDLFRTPSYKKYSKRVFQNTIISENKAISTSFTKSNTNFYFEDLAFSTNLKISDKNKLYVNYIYSKNKLNYSFSFKDNLKSRDELDINNQGLNLIYEQKHHSKLKSTFEIDYSYYGLNYSGEFKDDYTFLSSKENTIQKFRLKTDLRYRIKTKNRIKAGIQFSQPKVEFNIKMQDEADDNISFGFKDKQSYESYAVFSEYQLNKNDIYYFNLGVRLNYISASKNLYFEPRLFSKIRLGLPLYLKFSASMKSQNISQIIEFDFSDFGLENQVWALLNDENLPVLTSQQVLAGLEWKKNGLSLGLESYYKEIDGLTSISKAFVNRDQDYSEGSSRTFGLDALLRKHKNYWMYLLSYSLVNTEYKFYNLNGGKYFPGNYDIRHKLSFVICYNRNNFKFSLKWNWRTGKPFTQAKSILEDLNDENYAYIERGDINKRRLSPYHRLDFTTSYNTKLSNSENENLKLGFQLLNLYNRKSILDRTYNIKFDDTNYLREVNSYSLGITPNVFLRYEF